MNFSSCYLPAQNHSQFGSRLQALALDRLLEKGKQIQNLVAGEGKEEALYQLIVRQLGSPNNHDNFLRFATLLPWAEIQTLKRTLHPTIDVWICLFMYIAGFLEQYDHLKPIPADTIHGVKSLYSGLRMPFQIWKIAGQRPWNNPLRRLHGLAHFVHQWNTPSLYNIFKNSFISRSPYPPLLNTLYRFLSPEPSRFWKHTFYRSAVKPRFFWGRSLQTELIGNVLLPFFYQEALGAGSNGFADYLEEFFFYLPYAGTYGRLRFYWKWQEWKNFPGGRFYLNQALLKLLEGFCQNDSCASCPVGRVQEKI